MALCFLLFNIGLNAQTNRLDSLRQVLKTEKSDSASARILCQISEYFFHENEFGKSLHFAMQAKSIAQKCGYAAALANAYHLIGRNHAYNGNLDLALSAHMQALAIREKTGNKNSVAISYNSLGVINAALGNYTLAITNYLKALKIQEEINDKTGMANSFNNIGLIKQYQANYKDAMKDLFKALEIHQQNNDKKGMANVYSNIAGNYGYMGNHEEGLKYANLSLKIFEDLGNNKRTVATVLSNIGSFHQNLKNYSEAEKCFNLAALLQEEMNDKYGMTRTYHSLGLMYLKSEKLNVPQASRYLSLGYRLSKELNSKSLLRESSLYNFMLDSIKGNDEGAFKNYELMVLYSDSLLSTQNIENGMRIETAYELKKKENEAGLIQQKQEALSMAELEKQKQIVVWLVCMLVLALLMAIYATRMIRQKQKSNDEIVKQKEIIQNKQEEILDSIKYAKHIQSALLPGEKYIDKNLIKLKGKNNV